MQHENLASVPNVVSSAVTGHPGSGPGLPPSLRKLPRPGGYRLQLPAPVLLVSEVHQAEIQPRLVTANLAEGQQVAASLARGPARPAGLAAVTPAAARGEPVPAAGGERRARPARPATGWQQNTGSGRRAALRRRAAGRRAPARGPRSDAPFL